MDPIKLQLPDYFDVIKSPMDLGTVRKRLDGGTYYDTLDKVAADVKLTFDNAMLYNPPGQEIHKVGHVPHTGLSGATYLTGQAGEDAARL